MLDEIVPRENVKGDKHMNLPGGGNYTLRKREPAVAIAEDLHLS